MTTNRMGLEQSTLSDGELTVITDTDHVQCGDAAAMARELLTYRKASKEPIGEVCLGEYDDTGSHPDARVVCLHSHADWNNFTDGFKLFSTPPLQDVTVPEDVRKALSKMDDEIIAELDAEESACRAVMLKSVTNEP
ncbi:hypothetical protein D8682_26485 [Buttiauxella sp. 3AFRM03]|uniref:hypothetical protein n=1 Tax=Buttiauxella sp. 3AFRM03 TaxID=2479367 RepID=UPI000EF7A6C9|nr:hypothetical protein [Buttiauxella sp. 3AFRM03]AYN25721.1 hypothetical protein D8682_01210 [Buttiauxella sp. 3AFRM03]AYN30214.1 hypothetical protein D8682_26485 [Buttiauxella sp. 3AFRM03]